MSYEDHQGPLNLDDEVNALSEERLTIALGRAMRSFGWTLGEDPIPQDDEDFKTVYADELKKMVLNDITSDMLRKGLIEPARVDEDGEVWWKITEAGRRVCGDESS